jgi:hypothetical protein
MAHTQPALRCIPDAEHVAELLADAAQARIGAVATPRGRVAPVVMAAE